MTFLSMLYTLIISPLQLLFEVIFSIAFRLVGNAGFSIVILSIAVNFLVLPLYKRADELQAEERDIQAKMAYRIKRTKETFKGDERFFMLQEYYRINNYKPVYALKSSASLLLQIPFFIAAYRLLSGMQSLSGVPFGFISDLGKEDAVFTIGSFPVNVLPILMTLINVVTAVIYTKGHPLREKIQVYGLAAVFLILLYRSPSGLVFYWLLNNVFSLIKNLFNKLKEPKKALNIVLATAGAAVIIFSLIKPAFDVRQKILLISGGVLLALPLITGVLSRKKENHDLKGDKGVFFTGTILMALFTGLLVPSTVIDAAALEFIDSVHVANPIQYVCTSMLLSFGFWVLWGGVFYFFMSDKGKYAFCRAIWIISAVSAIDYLLFGRNLGTMSSTLQFDQTPVFKVSEYLINALAVAAVVILGGLLYKKFSKIIKYILIIGVLTVFMSGFLHFTGIIGTYTWFGNLARPSEEMPSIPLSRTGKNVIVLMMDRAMGTQVPYIFNEKPELKEKFDGFTYYPNTLSYGAHTNFAAPALFGGYDYTPEKINARSSESLVSKHNEALKVMPDIFGKNGYNVTICDPPYAGYKWIPDLSIYSAYPDFHCYNTNGRFNYFDDNGSSSVDMVNRVTEVRNRNFFMFSLMKAAPVVFQETIYDGGTYNSSNSGSDSGLVISSVNQKTNTVFTATGYDKNFLEAYSVLSKLPQITKITDDQQNTFLMMTNNTTHSPCLLQEPDYVPAIKVDNTAWNTDVIQKYTLNGVTMKMTNIHQVNHYNCNMAAYLKIGEWLDYLRANGVYDNTRIIIVSDHGDDLGQFDKRLGNLDLEFFMPLLMVKDFGAKGFTFSEELMTNADTPALATSGLVKDPVNPFTGNPINTNGKNGPQTVFYSDIINVDENNGNTFLPGAWLTVKGNPHDPSNWSPAGK